MRVINVFIAESSWVVGVLVLVGLCQIIVLMANILNLYLNHQININKLQIKVFFFQRQSNQRLKN